MLSRWQFTVLTSIGGLALLLVLANAALFLQNRADQASLAQRQQFVQQSVQLESLQREIVKSLAELAVGSNDRQVLDLLTAHGFSVATTAPPAKAAAGSNPETK